MGWSPPCPPPGDGAHRYVFQVYALDRKLDLKPAADYPELERAMKGHVLAAGEVVGRYQRHEGARPAGM